MGLRDHGPRNVGRPGAINRREDLLYNTDDGLADYVKGLLGTIQGVDCIRKRSPTGMRAYHPEPYNRAEFERLWMEGAGFILLRHWDGLTVYSIGH